MNAIKMNQLIFSNVEVDQSPTRKRGYQTLFYTHKALDSSELVEIESHLFYVSGENRPTKHVYFRTRNGNFVVAQMVPLQGEDIFGRKGRFFAHALILPEETFQHLDYNPFLIIDHFPFCTSVEEALAKGDFATGNILPIEFLVPTPYPPNADRQILQIVESEPLRDLILLASQASHLLEERKPLALIGDEQAMLELLRAFFVFIPPVLRSRCYFDTYFLEGSISHLPYWAIGLPHDTPQPARALIFDLKQRRFVSPVSVQPSNAFDRWLDWHFQKGKIPETTEEMTKAFSFGLWLEGQLADPEILKSVDIAMVQTFMWLNKEIIERRIEERLEATVGAALAKRLFPLALSWFKNQGGAALFSLQQDFDARLLIQWVQESYATQIQSPESSELNDLLRFAHKHQMIGLKIKCLRWAKKWDDLAKAVGQIDDDEFLRFSQWALKTVHFHTILEVHQDDSGLFFNIKIYDLSSQVSEAQQLFLALLGGKVILLPFKDYNKKDKKGMLQWLFKNRARDEEAPDQLAALPTSSINLRRWLQLMDLIITQQRGIK